MARILYGVMGDARGHVTRALTVAQEMSGHEFLFLGGGRVHDLKDHGFAVEDVPVPGTFYRDNKVDFAATLTNAVRVFATRSAVIRRVGDIMDSFDPDLILTDYEYFTPRAARKKGRLVMSLDHQHIQTHCAFQAPPDESFGRVLTSLAVKGLYSTADLFLIISFFSLPPIDPQTTHVLPAIIRNAVREHTPTDGEDVVVYQTSATFSELLPILEQLKHRVLIYGMGANPSRKNLVYKPFSTLDFIMDLASCRYAIVNGGHNVISEALYFGKPVFSFPIRRAYEQFINAYFLSQCGYGDYSIGPPSVTALQSFESRLDSFSENIKRSFRTGNQDVATLLERVMEGSGNTDSRGAKRLDKA